MDHRLGALAAARTQSRQAFPALCYAPFSQLHFAPDGAVAACSKSWWHPVGVTFPGSRVQCRR